MSEPAKATVSSPCVTDFGIGHNTSSAGSAVVLGDAAATTTSAQAPNTAAMRLCEARIATAQAVKMLSSALAREKVCGKLCHIRAVGKKKAKCLSWGSNPGSSAYKADALPLCY